MWTSNCDAAEDGWSYATEGEASEPSVLAWTDPVTGERLTVNTDGSESFLQALEPLGFEVLDGTSPGLDRLDVSAPGRRAWISMKANLNPAD